MLRRLVPDSMRWVAKLWRRVWAVTCFSMPAALAYRFTSRCTERGVVVAIRTWSVLEPVSAGEGGAVAMEPPAPRGSTTQ